MDSMDGFNNEIRIVLIGKTGNGKSSTGNTILKRKQFKAKCQVLAVTDRSSFGTRTLNKKRLVVVDTPGFLDTHRDREKMKDEIIKGIGLSVPGPHAVLYVMRIGDRLTDDEQNCIRVFTDMFGEQIFNFVIVVFTKGNDLDGKPLTQYFQEAPHPFQNLLKKCSYRMLALDNKGTDCEKTEAVDKLLDMIDTMTDGQTYYTGKMLQSAQLAFEKRVKEIRQVDKVRWEIEVGGKAFEYLKVVGGVTSIVVVFMTGTAIVGSAVAAAKFAGSAVTAAKVAGSAVTAAKVAGSAIVATEVCCCAGVAAEACVCAVEASKVCDCAVVTEEAGGLFSKCSIL